jgi:hypothetical protein
VNLPDGFVPGQAVRMRDAIMRKNNEKILEKAKHLTLYASF